MPVGVGLPAGVGCHADVGSHNDEQTPNSNPRTTKPTLTPKKPSNTLLESQCVHPRGRRLAELLATAYRGVREGRASPNDGTLVFTSQSFG
ncbi:hypothetical protein C8J57DRAFT_1500132 [Mycena rebaudengoi]|nr:hypothetical protein C8J57DRAFT_1500132 [Mycena rebaudengoi]